jgi:hypothetical protein
MGKDLEGSSGLIRYYPSICLEGLKTSVSIAGVEAEIRTERLPNACLDRYR